MSVIELNGRMPEGAIFAAGQVIDREKGEAILIVSANFPDGSQVLLDEIRVKYRKGRAGSYAPPQGAHGEGER